MRQSHEEELTPEQMQELATGQARVVEKQRDERRLIEDHQLRLKCVDLAIRSMDALPQLANVHVTGATSVTNNFQFPNVRQIAEGIYAFVSEPLRGITNNILD